MTQFGVPVIPLIANKNPLLSGPGKINYILNFGEIPSSMRNGRRISIHPNFFLLLLVSHTNTSQWAWIAPPPTILATTRTMALNRLVWLNLCTLIKKNYHLKFYLHKIFCLVQNHIFTRWLSGWSFPQPYQGHRTPAIRNLFS